MTHTTLRPAARAAFIAAGLIALAGPALAHHPLGGETPGSFGAGLLSGIGHPMLGLDHFAFIAAMGLAAAAIGRRWIAPLGYLAAMVAGVLLTFSGATLPLVEIMVAGSAVLVGGIVLSGRRLSPPVAMAIFAVAGLFHGAAFGDAIVGGETTPLAAYLVGLALTQYAIAVAIGLVATRVWHAADASSVPLRVAGGLAAGVGFAFLFENVEGLVFPALV